LPERRIKLTLEYDGRGFSGWQRQARGGGESVQEAVEGALAKVFKRAVTLNSAGRTDAGVHALGMVAHFEVDARMPVERLPIALVAHLPESIRARSAEEVARDFDARRDAMLRWYRYQIVFDRLDRPLGPRAWRQHPPLDLNRMGAMLRAVEGEHDFGGFRAAGCNAERTILTMREATLWEGDGGRVVALDFKCRSFLQRMVRLLVGAAVAVGAGRRSVEEIRSILKTGRRPNAIRAAPAEGLCLMRVAYDEAESENILTAHPTPPSF
jgi:tRNA pseudouridine38-40 synthase